MSFTPRSTYKSTITSDFSGSSNKWSGIEVQVGFTDLADSVAWEHHKVTMSTNNYDCSNGNLQERTLTTNSSLTISNAEQGKYYTLIKKGSFTLALPTGQYTSSTATVPSGTALVTFLYDGANYFFSFSAYSAT